MSAGEAPVTPWLPNAFTLGGREVRPPLVLAPMLDLTGRAFRNVVREYGGCGLFYSEMLSARRAAVEPAQSPMLAGCAEENDLMLQVLGRDPEELTRALVRLEAWQPAGFDWNLGCSRGKIMCWGGGAELLKRPVEVACGLKALRRATQRPLTVKVRVPEGATTAAWRDFLCLLADEGADGVCVHARTPERAFARPAQWEWIALAKQCLKIPVVGNGDVASSDEALAMFRETGCDGVMIGRFAAARPWLFREIAARLTGSAVPDPPPAEEALEKLLAHLGPELDTPKRTRELRTFCEYFAASQPVPHWFWGPLQSLRDGPQLAAAARAYFQRHAQAGGEPRSFL
jgi:nifR3 family TIM-barrel protein